MKPLLQVQDLSVRTESRYGADLTLFEGANLTLNAGERLTVVGESGAGKSLLAQAIMGALPAGLVARGQVHIAGHATNGERALTLPLWGSTVTMLPQEPWSALSPLMRILPQVAEAARYAQKQSWAQALQAAQERLAQLGLAQAGGQWLHQISGGMAQRVGIAASGLAGASLLIADEPTKGLDSSSVQQVAQLLLGMQGAGQALLTITHDLDLAEQLGGQLMVMQQGQVVESGLASEVLSNPQHAYTKALLAAQPRHWLPLVQAVQPDAQQVISAQGLGKAFSANKLFTNIDLSLKRSEIMAVSGVSGCGKTTLGNMLLGLVQADAGKIERTSVPAWKFQKLYQDPPAAFSPHRQIGAALQDIIARHGLDASKIEPLMAQLKLHSGLLARLPAQVSGGELQRLALLRLLLLEPAFIFADEPSSRLDVITQQQTMALLCEAAQASGCAVLLVSHDAHLASACSHQHLSLGVEH
ncbi:ATP-binding cassette domain-containing protein [Variovorax sp. PCZ-1]|uniref:ABC transporter ATP-binding protein n=1 Tax=Variovorax sp. PCZ-1 TaxID=2835533 RepID=UPI001BCEB784|nr:ATP-binding cassette domain-containing protein [Variovorax sp. PCZ-1]MBS7807220.1 ABC transporter ATP-binding protein [Variovorax sp. PCZ-1]